MGSEERVDVVAHLRLEKAAAVEDRLAAQRVGDGGQELAGLIEGHLIAFGFFEVEGDESRFVGLRGVEEVLDLRRDVGVRSPVIGAPEKAGVERGLAAVRVLGIGPGGAGGGLVDDAPDSGCGSALEAGDVVVVVDVDDAKIDLDHAYIVGEIGVRHKCEGPREAGLLDCRYLAFFFVVVFFGFSAASFFGAAFFEAFFFGASSSSSSASGFAFSFFGAALPFLAGVASSFGSVSSLKSTNSRMAISAASPRRGPSLMMRV